MPGTSAELNKAIQYHHTGRLREAEMIYREILALDPNHSDALHLLGFMAHQRGNNDLAVKLIKKAIQIHPDSAFYYNNLALVLLASGKPKEAILCCQMGLKLSPNMAEAHCNMGNALKAQGKISEAIICYQKAIDVNPGSDETHNLMGAALLAIGKPNEAMVCFDKAIHCNPNQPAFFLNMGKACCEAKKIDEAIFWFKKALATRPNYAEAHHDMAIALKATGQLDEALVHCEKAIELRPNYARTLCSMGVILKEKGRLQESAAAHQKAIDIEPQYAEAYHNMGITLKTQGRFKEAVSCLEKALILKPDLAGAYFVMADIFQHEGKMTEAETCYQQGLDLDPKNANACFNMGTVYQGQGKIEKAVEYYEKSAAIDSKFSKHIHSNLLMNRYYDPEADAGQLLAEAENWEKQHGNFQKFPFSHKKNTDHRNRLRIGYISPDFRRHSVSWFLLPLLSKHDREKFEIFCYSDVRRPDDITRQIEDLSDHWRPVVNLDDGETATKIHGDCIDILVDLAGHTGNNRLGVFAFKPAPVQVTWLGFPGTTGLKAMDYRITDAIADPPGEADSFHSEELVRLPNGFLCYSPPKEAPEISEPPMQTRGAMTFGSFNNPQKINQRVVFLWSRILHEIPYATLLLKNRIFADMAIKSRYLDMFLKNGIPSERVKIMDHIPSVSEHLAIYNRVDIALDTFPYNGTTTTCEALWMGVPVITLAGNRHAARVGASLMTTVRLNELIAGTENEYLKKAAWLASDIEQLKELRGNIRRQMQDSCLCNAVSFARNMENAFLKMIDNRR